MRDSTTNMKKFNIIVRSEIRHERHERGETDRTGNVM